jgi:hypothetical protein
VAAIAVLGTAQQLHSHLRGALNTGASHEEVEAVLELVAPDLTRSCTGGRGSSGRTLRIGDSDRGFRIGANYRAACRARSRKEFIAKMGIVEEEVAITIASIRTAREGGRSVPRSAFRVAR